MDKRTGRSLTFVLWALSANVFAQRPTQQPEQQPTGTQTPSGSSTQTETTAASKQGWSYDPDAGIVFKDGDFKWISWAYGERVFRVDAPNFWRRVRQGMEFDLPRFSQNYRFAFIYEVDFTDSNFFRVSPKSHIFENVFWSVQNAGDPNKFRALFGQNTHILTYEDSLSSGNLPTINRSLILEEHGSVNSFGTQFGIQIQKTLSSKNAIAFSAQDNRGSFNTPHPRYVVGNDLAVKLTRSVINNDKTGRKFTVGAGADHTRDIRNRMFTLSSTIGADALGGTVAAGNKLTFEAYGVYSEKLKGHPFTLESEGLHSNFSQSGTHVGGGYVLGQFSLFDQPRRGDLDPFFRYDFVRLGRNAVTGLAFQQAIRLGFNYNLPFTRKLVNFHLEYARNAVQGPTAIVPHNRSLNELGLELRFNITRYTRH